MNDVARILELRDRLPGEWAGLLTRSAQALAAVQDQSDERRCRGCGSSLPQQYRGRPRKWCQAPECQNLRKRGGKSAQKARVAS